MPTPTRPERPVFLDGAQYVRITTRSLEGMAKDPSLSNPYRLQFYAMAKANRDGHAELAPGQLRRLLGREGKEASPATVSKALRAAREAGLLGAESGTRCLVVDHREVSQGQGRAGCIFHGISHVAVA